MLGQLHLYGDEYGEPYGIAGGAGGAYGRGDAGKYAGGPTSCSQGGMMAREDADGYGGISAETLMPIGLLIQSLIS